MKAPALRSIVQEAPLRACDRTRARAVPSGTHVSDAEVSRIQRKAACACGGGCPSCQSKSKNSNLPVTQPNDASETEADRIAAKVIRMDDTPSPANRIRPDSLSGTANPVIQTRSETGAAVGHTSGFENNSGQSGGGNLDNSTRSFMQSRFGTDFGGVKIHTDAQAVRMSRELHARAFTVGNDIYFDEGQYRPDSIEGKQLLAHELTHTIQQRSAAGLSVQRKKYDGNDDAGFYTIDDDACTFEYRQDWFFDFAKSGIAAADQPAFMASGKSQVEGGWSRKFKLISGNTTCPCGAGGFTVDVVLNTFNQKRKGRHGYTIDVVSGRTTSEVNPVTSTGTMQADADTPQNLGHTVPQDIMAHEFGHTLGIQDEYIRWSSIFGVPGSGDKSSLMNVGNDLKPWHYQHFADILNFEIARCTFFPEGTAKRSSLAEPVSQLGLTTGAFFDEASLARSKAEFIIGLNIDARVSNDAVLGLFYPTLGFDAYWNVKDSKVTIGPTAGLRLNRLAHPLYLDVSTGVLFDPGGNKEDLKINIPLSTTLGIRGKGFNLGVNYTPMVDLLSGGKYSHIIGVNLQLDVK